MANIEIQLPVVSSLVIQVRPELRQTVEDYIHRHPGAEIHGSDERSKLVVVAEMANDIELADFMNALGDIPGVITVSMVFHHTDSAPTIISHEVNQHA